jgi:hypothetical protein
MDTAWDEKSIEELEARRLEVLKEVLTHVDQSPLREVLGDLDHADPGQVAELRAHADRMYPLVREVKSLERALRRKKQGARSS